MKKIFLFFIVISAFALAMQEERMKEMRENRSMFIKSRKNNTE